MKHWLVALVAAVLVGAASHTGAAAQQGASSRTCVQPLERGDPFAAETDRARLNAILQECGRAATGERGERAAIARFYAGRAASALGLYNDAIRNLLAAVSVGPDFPNFAREQRAAQLELAQAYRLAGDAANREAARGLLTRLANTAPGDPALAYQRALFDLSDLRAAGRDDAFNALKDAFVLDDQQLLNAQAYPLSPEQIRRGRSLLYWLGVSLGEESLARQTRDPGQRVRYAQDAVGYFEPATRAISASNWQLGPAEGDSGVLPANAGAAPSAAQLGRAFFELGAAHLRAAGVADAEGLSTIGEAGGLDCLGGARADSATGHFADARRAFQKIMERNPNNADAHWGLACATLANLPNAQYASQQQAWLAEAISHLRLDTSNRPDTLLTLARAQVMQNDLANARNNYSRALACLPGAAGACGASATANYVQTDPDRIRQLRARIYVEIARTYYVRTNTTQLVNRIDTDLYARTITEINEATSLTDLQRALGDLNQALNIDSNNVAARLLIGHIDIQLNRHDAALDTLARFRQRGSETSLGGPEGLYLLSMRLTNIEQARLEPETPTGRPSGGGEAVDYARRAMIGSQRPEFRRQTCLAQTLFGYTADDQNCAAADQTDPEALLVEGMYWLRRGHKERDLTRMSSWSLSLQKFEAGRRLVSPDQTVLAFHQSDGRLNLSDLLRYGERYVQNCARLADRERANEGVRRYFRQAGMPNPCA
ncbi:MAG: hypothetical protein AB7L65_00555 [Hyphomonadaceae bacterium]